MHWRNQTAVHEDDLVEALQTMIHTMTLTLNKSKHDAHKTVGIPTIYLIEEFDKMEYARPTVRPAKTILKIKLLRILG